MFIRSRKRKEKNIFFDTCFDTCYAKYPLVLIDVGASGGMQDRWRLASRYLHFVGFEPDARSFAELKDIEFSGKIPATYLSVGLYNKKTTVDFYLLRRKKCSSLFKPNFSWLESFPGGAERLGIESVSSMCVDTLDNQLREHGIRDPDFIKIDTQGSEPFILEGAKHACSESLLGAEIEVEFNSLYENQPLFADVDNFMRKSGFQLFDLNLGYWKRKAGLDVSQAKGQLLYADALYFKSLEGLAGMINALHDPLEKKAKLLKILSICALFGYADYGLEIASLYQDMFDEKERKTIEWGLKHCIDEDSNPLHFWGQRTITKALRSLVRRIKPPVKPQNWQRSAGILGNAE